MIKCDVAYLFTDKHRGEDWYECRTCGAREWFGYRDNISNNTVLNSCPHKPEVKQ